MANLLLHLNYAEEVLYPFIALYQTGYIHQLCATFKTNKKKCSQTILEILAHFYKCIPVTNNEKNTNIILKPLSNDIQQVINQHNQQTIDFYRKYIETYSYYYLQDQYTNELNLLPFIKQQISPIVNDLPNLKDDQFIHSLLGTIYQQPGVNENDSGACKNDAGANNDQQQEEEEGKEKDITASCQMNPFVKLSNNQVYNFNQCQSIEQIKDLCHKNSLLFDTNNTPAQSIENLICQPIQMNSYILNFYEHGHLHLLIKENHLKKSDVWNIINDWCMFLSDLNDALEQLIINTSPTPIYTIDPRTNRKRRTGHHSSDICKAFYYLATELKAIHRASTH